MSDICPTLRERLGSRDDVELAILFGSAARGTARASSDVDLAVLWREGEPADCHAVLADIERAIGRPIDLVDLASAPPQLRFEIAREGVALVEHTRGAWSRWRARAFLDWWDFRPIARMIHRAARARLGTAGHGSP